MQPLKTAFWVVVLVPVFLLLLGHMLWAAEVWITTWLPFAHMLDQVNINEHFDKWVRLSLFTLLGALAVRIWREQRMFKAVVLWFVMLGIGKECLQHYMPERGASVGDLTTAMLGLAMGSVALLVGVMVGLETSRFFAAQAGG
ncbi:VanZ family protein [Delftia acidovorans]|uniref:VanZ family protein n=1 Tax=Delftia acidovorans TaxID=80866 RepID=UPI0022AB6D12|nr:VanZ family protein [Delftia acidovorans]WAT83486.1 VanZ family protein [Delftia acidovorans]WAT84369.1 VanZ family protein [Delftia acidovorans]